jgi:hypothetical protein
MNMKRFIAIALCLFGAPTWANADGSNRSGWAVTLTTASPTPVLTATPTPNGVTVDPLANATTVKEYRFLQGLMGAGSTHHLVQGMADVVRICYNKNNACASDDAANYNGNGNWGDPSSSPCIFGAGSPANAYAINAWNQGRIAVMGMHFPNPWNNWNNVPSNSNPVGVDSPQMCPTHYVPYSGIAYDCYGANDATIQAMITGGANSGNWNAELDSFASGIAHLQAHGVTVIMKTLHEYNFNDFWWTQASDTTQLALFRYIENYFNNVKGLHNLLWATVTLDRSPVSRIRQQPAELRPLRGGQLRRPRGHSRLLYARLVG